MTTFLSVEKLASNFPIKRISDSDPPNETTFKTWSVLFVRAEAWSFSKSFKKASTHLVAIASSYRNPSYNEKNIYISITQQKSIHKCKAVQKYQKYQWTNEQFINENENYYTWDKIISSLHNLGHNRSKWTKAVVTSLWSEKHNNLRFFTFISGNFNLMISLTNSLEIK